MEIDPNEIEIVIDAFIYMPFQFLLFNKKKNK